VLRTPMSVFRTSIPSCSELRCPCFEHRERSSEHLCCYVPNSVAEVINRAFGIIYCGSESFNRAAGVQNPDAAVWNTVFGIRSTGVGLPNSDTGIKSSISKQEFLTFEPVKKTGTTFLWLPSPSKRPDNDKSVKLCRNRFRVLRFYPGSREPGTQFFFCLLGFRRSYRFCNSLYLIINPKRNSICFAS